MNQILQNLKTGVTELVNVPCPQVKPGQLLIRTTSSLVSASTERMLVDYGKARFLKITKQQPAEVRPIR